MLPCLQVSSIKAKENLFILEMRKRKNGVEKLKSYFHSVAQRMGEGPLFKAGGYHFVPISPFYNMPLVMRSMQRSDKEDIF